MAIPGPQVLGVTTASSVSTSTISSTKARVTNSGPNPVYFAVGPAGTAAFANNCEMIPSGTIKFVNMLGSITNVISFLANVGSTNVTVQQIGSVSSTAMAQNSNVYVRS